MVEHKGAQEGDGRIEQRRDDAGERDYPADDENNQKDRDRHQKHPPVGREHERAGRHDALAALEVEIQREAMTDDTENSGEIAHADQVAAFEPLAVVGYGAESLEQEKADKHRRDTFERVAYDGDDSRHLAHRAQHVRKARVAAAHLADIALALGDDPGHDDGRVDAAYQVCYHRDRQKQIPIIDKNTAVFEEERLNTRSIVKPFLL